MRACMRYLINHPQPSYLRLDKSSNFTIHKKIPKIYPGKWLSVYSQNNNNTAYLTTGSVVEYVQKRFLKKKNYSLYSLPLWGMRYKKLQYNFIKKFDKLFVVEDHFQDGGFQSWLNESLNKKNCKTKLESKALSFAIMEKVGSKDYLMNYLR